MAEIKISGTIMDNDSADIMRWYGWYDVACPMDIENGLNLAGGEDVEILVNSDGGDLLAGLEMCAHIDRYKGKVTAVVQSRAASAATVAIASCSKIIAESYSMYCVHNPSTYTYGDHRDHEATAESLRAFKESIINAYRRRVKSSREDFWELMDQDKWITAGQAKEYGLVDEIRGEETEEAGTVYTNAVGRLFFPTAEMRERYANEKKEKENQAKRSLAMLDLLSK